jgi:hypothetical protein
MQRVCGRGTIVVALIVVLALVATPEALAGPTYTVMNAEGGIYWRSAPTWEAAERISGFGVYNGTTIEVHCYQSGSSVPGSADTMWEQATDVGGRGYGSGWVNEHFINDGQPINQPSPGVGPCNPPPPPHEEVPPPPVEEHPSGGLIFPIFNSEGGIYYRNSPHWADTPQTPGVGVYNGDQVQLICGAFGDAVGPYNDTAWSYVNNLSRPVGDGWVNEHFINDGALSNKFVAGEPMCGPSTPGLSGGGSGGGGSGSGGGSAAPSQLPGGASIYYSPYDGNRVTWHHGLSSATVVPAASVIMNKSQWSQGTNCTDTLAIPPANYGGETGISGNHITMLSGWSYGRNGPIMLLAAQPTWVSQINYILLIDPGSLNDYQTGVCDKAYPHKAALIAKWLASNPANKLVILAGKDTADYSHPYQGRGHGGIQSGLFTNIKAHPMIGNRDLRKQVVVCNYDTMIHHVIWQKFAYETGNPTPITIKTCPLARGFPTPLSWTP